jgi:two-component system, NtrC family, response regulator HydG
MRDDDDDARTPSDPEPDTPPAVALTNGRERPKVLVVEDDPDIRKILEMFLTEKGFRVKVAEGAQRALELLPEEPIDLILSDVRMPGMSGLDLLRHLKERDPEIQLVLMSAYSSVKDAVEAIRLGAADYVEKPIDFRRLERVLQTVFEKRRLEQRTRILEQRLQGTVTFEGMVARSPQMLAVHAFIERLARYPTTALITGESGTGKELVARALYRLSPLRDHAFVVCNCTTLAPTLLESELFGHVKGSFTGADRDRKGLFEAAHGGTIFLDEIGELPLGVQVKLLRVLENREIKRIGSPDPIRIDIRVIAATNRDLGEMVRQGTFRDDLYYRLNVGAIHLPPLRQRTDDIEPLAHHFLGLFNEKLGRHVTGASPQVLEIFSRYPWPGNVRELANVIERALVVCKGNVIVPECLPPHLFETRTALPGEAPEMPDLTLQAAEREQILRALQASGGKRVEAARRLGLSRRTLYRKLSRYGIT